MIKKVIGLTFILAATLTTAWSISQNNEVKLVDLTLDNVEALASCEKTAGSCWLDSRGKCCDAGDWGCSPCGH